MRFLGFTLLMVAALVATVLIIHSEAYANSPPEVSISAGGSSVVEGGWAQFTISANPAPNESLTVEYEVSLKPDDFHQVHRGPNYSGTIWGDKNLGAKTVTLSRDQGSITIAIPTNDDSAYYYGASLEVALVDGSSYSVGNRHASVRLIDNEPAPRLTISADSGSVNEGDTAVFTISGQTAKQDAKVRYRVKRIGTFPTEEDYDGTVGQPIYVHAVRDTVDKPGGHIIVTLLPGEGYRLGTPSTASMTVENVDIAPRLSIRAEASQYQEGQVARFVISSNVDIPELGLIVHIQGKRNGEGFLSHHIRMEDDEYIYEARTIPGVGEPGGKPDGKFDDGSLVIWLVPLHGYVLADESVARVDILDVDSRRPSITVSAGPGIEEGETASFIVSANPAPSGSLTVNYRVSESGDYTDSAGSKTVSLSGSSAVVTVDTVDDLIGEPDGTVSVAIGDGSGYQVGTPSSASVSVYDDEGYPTVTLSTSATSVNEGDSFDVTFDASEPRMTTFHDLTVRYQVIDRGRVIARSVNLPTRQTSRTVTIKPTDDTKVTPDGPLTVEILPGLAQYPGEEYRVGSPSSVTVNVKETDTETPTISLSGPSSVTEGNPMVYTVTASSPPKGGSVSVGYKVRRSYDYGSRVASTEIGDKYVSLTGTSTTITVPTIDDDIYDGPGAYVTSLHEVSGYRVVNRSVGTDLVDDDVEPDITVKTVNTDGSAEGAPAEFVIEAAPAPAGSLTVNYYVDQEGAAVDASYLGSHSVTLTNAAPSQTISIATDDDAVEQRRLRWVTVTITNGRGYTYEFPDARSSHYVLDNDRREDVSPTISVTGPTEVNEGSDAEFTITSSPAPGGSLTVSYRVSQEGGYVAASDLGLKSVVVTTATTTVTVPTVSDGVDELDGSVTLTLASGQDYEPHDTAYYATVVVKDDDVVKPDLSIISFKSALVEGEKVDARVFTISAETAPNVTVKYHVSQSGDFVSAANLGDQTLQLDEYGYGVIVIPTVDDEVDEANGSITVTLASSTDYTIVGVASVTVNVADNDDPPSE